MYQSLWNLLMMQQDAEQMNSMVLGLIELGRQTASVCFSHEALSTLVHMSQLWEVISL